MARKILYPVIDGKKQCGECGQWFNISEFSKFKNKYYSSKCRKCINKYGREYRRAPKNKEKIKEYHKQYMKDETNRENKNSYTRKYRKSSAVKEKNIETNRIWKKNEKQKAVDYKGGKCSICGYHKCLTALEFHHTDPTEKDGYNSHWTFERNAPELDKCVLVCANCHREIHAREIWYE